MLLILQAIQVTFEMKILRRCKVTLQSLIMRESKTAYYVHCFASIAYRYCNNWEMFFGNEDCFENKYRKEKSGDSLMFQDFISLFTRQFTVFNLMSNISCPWDTLLITKYQLSYPHIKQLPNGREMSFV